MISFMSVERVGENVDYLGQKYWLEVGFGSRENRFVTVTFR